MRQRTRPTRTRRSAPAWLCNLGCRTTGATVVALFLSSCGGTVNDLLREAQLGSPEAIERAVVAISDLLVVKERAGITLDEVDLAAVEYMRKVAVNSKVQNNRAVAISSLGRLRSVDVSETLLSALDDSFWLSRLLAVQAMRDGGTGRNKMRQSETDGFSTALVDLLDRETQPEVKRELIAALGVIADELSVKTLYEHFLDLGGRRADRNDRQNAFFVLKKLTGLSYSFDDKSRWKEAYHQRFDS